MKYPPITSQGFEGCYQFLVDALAGRKADPSLLVLGLPQGPILSAELRTEDGNAYIYAVFRDQKDGRARTPRRSDPEGFLSLRLHLLPKSHLRMSKTNKPTAKRPRPERHYVTLYREQVFLQRLISDAGVCQEASLRDHHSLAREDICLRLALPDERTGRTHRDRAFAIEIALRNFDRAKQFGILEHLTLSREEYEKMLTSAYALLDRLPLGSGKSDTEAAE